MSRGELGSFRGQWSPLFLYLTHSSSLFSYQVISGALYLMEEKRTGSHVRDSVSVSARKRHQGTECLGKRNTCWRLSLPKLLKPYFRLCWHQNACGLLQHNINMLSSFRLCIFLKMSKKWKRLSYFSRSGETSVTNAQSSHFHFLR